MKTIITYRYYGNKTKQIIVTHWFNTGKEYICRLEDGTSKIIKIDKLERMEVK